MDSALTRLVWRRARHFRWDSGILVGRTAIGRVTFAVLHMNDPLRIELRKRLIEEGLLPPSLPVG